MVGGHLVILTGVDATIAVSLLALLAASCAFGGRSASSATLLIRLQHSHGHAWSLNGGPIRAAQTLHLQAGGTVTVISHRGLATAWRASRQGTETGFPAPRPR